MCSYVGNSDTLGHIIIPRNLFPQVPQGASCQHVWQTRSKVAFLFLTECLRTSDFVKPTAWHRDRLGGRFDVPGSLSSREIRRPLHRLKGCFLFLKHTISINQNSKNQNHNPKNFKSKETQTEKPNKEMNWPYWNRQKRGVIPNLREWRRMTYEFGERARLLGFLSWGESAALGLREDESTLLLGWNVSGVDRRKIT